MEALLGWDVLGGVIGVLVPLGVGLLSLNDFRLAKACFVIAAFILGAKAFMWGISTQNGLGIRATITILSFGLIGLFLVESSRWIDRKQARAQDDKVDAKPATNAPAVLAPSDNGKQEAPKTLFELFQRQLDFPQALGLSREYVFSHKANKDDQKGVPFCVVQAKMYSDSSAHVRFMGFFVPVTCQGFDACRAILQFYDKMTADLSSGAQIMSGQRGSNIEDTRTYPFSGRVLIYTDSPMTMKERGILDDVYTRRGLSLLFRDSAFLFADVPRPTKRQ